MQIEKGTKMSTIIKHLSIRVPWHESGWANGSCTCNIEKERSLGDNPPCLKNSGAFMSGKIHTIHQHHPYANPKNTDHKFTPFNDIVNTSQDVPAFSLIGIPYKYMLKNDESNVHSIYNTGFDAEKNKNLGGENWISHGVSQQKIFDYFYKDIQKDESLVVPYAKFCSLTDTPGSIIVGIGKVTGLGEIKQYPYSETHQTSINDITPRSWERSIQHSIRNDAPNGFLIPFDSIKKYLEDHYEENPDDFLIIVPGEFRGDFAYVTTHSSHDALIWLLNRAIEVIDKYIEKNIAKNISWRNCQEWCRAELKKVWQQRGIFPGLGALLSAQGIPFGYDVLNDAKSELTDENIFDEITEFIAKNRSVNVNLKKLTLGKFDEWKDDFNKNKDYYKIISRLVLTHDQAQFLLTLNDKTKKQIIENPYILHEITSLYSWTKITNILDDKNRIKGLNYYFGIKQIDYAIFRDPEIFGNKFMEIEQDDKRRIRAITVNILLADADAGSTLLPIDVAISKIMEFRSDYPIKDITKKRFEIDKYKQFFDELFIQKEILLKKSEEPEAKSIALKLHKYVEIDNLINEKICKKADLEFKNKVNRAEIEQLILNEFKIKKLGDGEKEKLDCLEIVANSPVSVLTGGAGTGKTTALSVLCEIDEIKNGDVLAIAPTGKATVVLRSKLPKEVQIKTVFQYLHNTKHCDVHTWSYYLTGQADTSAPATVIIDESSMLTEDMFAALIEACSTAKRIVFVGDPNQLPPIGAGKPFADLIKFLTSKNKVVKLEISNRHKSEGSNERLDVQLSKNFTEDKQKTDYLLNDLAKDNSNIEFVKYETADEIQNKISEIFEKIEIKNVDSFNKSLGGTENKGRLNFTDINKVDCWQILSPYKNKAEFGSSAINKQIHEKYRLKDGNIITGSYKVSDTQRSLGDDLIIFGDKVINIQNQNRKHWKYNKGWPDDKATQFIANGDIGIVNYVNYSPYAKWYEKNHKIEFISQPGAKYPFKASSNGDSDSQLELAYALTVHKSQRSGFKTTIFVINEPDNLPVDAILFSTTREMIYTAITRQVDKVFVLYNKEPFDLLKYAHQKYSNLAQRRTDLLNSEIPEVIEYKNRYYDSSLIHLTTKGDLVRSKSEVIVANALYYNKIAYEYERLIEFENGDKVLPDFTLKLENGKTLYWEHLGMLNNKEYKKHWTKKLKIYKAHRITEEIGNLILSVEGVESKGINTQDIENKIKLIKEKK
jgi:ATP-dependent exoDNAse (exonuclease V) alpha subunit